MAQPNVLSLALALGASAIVVALIIYFESIKKWPGALLVSSVNLMNSVGLMKSTKAISEKSAAPTKPGALSKFGMSTAPAKPGALIRRIKIVALEPYDVLQAKKDVKCFVDTAAPADFYSLRSAAFSASALSESIDPVKYTIAEFGAHEMEGTDLLSKMRWEVACNSQGDDIATGTGHGLAASDFTHTTLGMAGQLENWKFSRCRFFVTTSYFGSNEKNRFIFITIDIEKLSDVDLDQFDKLIDTTFLKYIEARTLSSKGKFAIVGDFGVKAPFLIEKMSEWEKNYKVGKLSSNVDTEESINNPNNTVFIVTNASLEKCGYVNTACKKGGKTKSALLANIRLEY